MLVPSSRPSKSRTALALGIVFVGIAGGAGLAIWAVRRQRRELGGPELSPQLPSPPPGSPSAQPSAAPDVLDAGLRQPAIIAALWRSVRDADPDPLTQLKAQLVHLSPELQAYVVCATSAVNDAYVSGLQFRQEFATAFDKYNEDFERQQKQLDGALAAAGGALSVANPVIGVLIGLVLAIKQLALKYGVKPENRKVEENEQIFRDWEGSDCLRGLHLENVPNPSVAQLQLAIDTDLIASRLPAVRYAHQFEFTPAIEQYRLTAFKLGLYSEESLRRIYGFSKVWNLRPGDMVPLNAVQISQYTLGYTLAQNGGEYLNRSDWGQIGYTDGIEGRPPRCSAELSLWADAMMAKWLPAEPEAEVAPPVPAEQISAKDLRDYLDGYEEGKANPYIGPQAKAGAYYNAGILDGQAGNPPRYTAAQP